MRDAEYECSAQLSVLSGEQKAIAKWLRLLCSHGKTKHVLMSRKAKFLK
jgi:hypothetical protein